MDKQRQTPESAHVVNEQTPAAADQAQNALDIQLRKVLEQLCPGDVQRQERLGRALRQLLRVAFSNNELRSPAQIKSLLQRAIVDIQKRVKLQVDEIVHAEKFQLMESTWRGLKFLTERTSPDAPITIDLLDASKDVLRSDLKRNDDYRDTALRAHIYKDGIGIAGGEPYAAMIGLYDFSHDEEDVAMLDKLGDIAQDAHAPFISAASPKLFGVKDFPELPSKKLSPIVRTFEKDENYIKWLSFRKSDKSRYVCLTLPRFVLRSPWGEGNTAPGKLHFYKESTSGDRKNYLWGNAALALASRLTDQFAKYGWYDDISGWEEGGRVDRMPIPSFQLPGEQRKIATEMLVDDEMEYALSTLGFTPLVMHLKTDSAYFQSVPTLKFAGTFPDTEQGRKAQERAQMGTQLTYMLLASRVAHYLKVQQRLLLGTPKNEKDIAQRITDWIKQYYSDDPTPQPATRKLKPIRFFKVDVAPIEGEVGYYTIDVQIVPFTRYRGADVTLTLDAQPSGGNG